MGTKHNVPQTPKLSSSGSLPSNTHRKYLNKQNSIIYSEKRIVQNFTLFWLDENIDVTKTDCQYTLRELQKIVYSVTMCNEPQVCQNFIEKVRDEQIFIILSGALGQKFVQLVHHYTRVELIYIFCGDPAKHSEWVKKWPKIRLVTNQIEDICEALVKDVAYCEQDLIPTSALSSGNNESQQLKSFLDSLLLKDALLEINYNDQSAKVLANFCRKYFTEDENQLKLINEFERDYHKHTPIWWYSREGFTYAMLNRSLRTIEPDIVAVMGFFMKDIHQQIEKEYLKRPNRKALFTVYRGQGIIADDFKIIQNDIGGLYSFNSFLSTSTDRNVAVAFAKKRKSKPNKIPIVFELEIDPTLTKTPFASLNDLSYYGNKEEEILFSMHTIFRIMEVKEGNEGIWNVKLKSANDEDRQVGQLMEKMRGEMDQVSAVDRFVRLTTTIDQYSKADEFYHLLLETLSQTNEKLLACIYRQLGYIKFKQGKLLEVKPWYDRALKIQEKLHPSSELELAGTYSCLGLWYASQTDDSNALLYHRKALAIQEKCLDNKSFDLASTYDNIGLIYYQQKDFPSALSYYEKACKIYESTIPQNHLRLAIGFKNIGLAKISLGKREDGVENLHKALKMLQTALPANDPSIASVCATIGETYHEMKDYSAAYPFFEQALRIEKESSDSNPLKLAMAYHNMSTISNDLGKYAEAVKYAQLAVNVTVKSHMRDHPDVILFKKNYEKLQQQQS